MIYIVFAIAAFCLLGMLIALVLGLGVCAKWGDERLLCEGRSHRPYGVEEREKCGGRS